MAGVSLIDAHPLRNQFIDMMLKGIPAAKIAAAAGVSHETVRQYRKRYVRPAMKANLTTVNPNTKTSVLIENQSASRAELKLDVSRENWLARVRKHEPLMDKAIEKAAEDGNHSGLATVASTRLKALELEAKATGILDDRPVTNASFVMMQGGDSHQVIEAEFRYSSESDEELSTDTTE